MNILYFGNSETYTTSFHRAEALKRLNHKVEIIDPYLKLKKELGSFFWSRFHFKSGYRFIQNRMLHLCKSLVYDDVDIIWINGGELFGQNTLDFLHKTGAKLVLYNNDDPAGGRDKRRFDLLIKGIPIYDLCVVMREINIAEFTLLGAKNVLRVMMSYDEVAHMPYSSVDDIQEMYKSDIVFVGTWMRGEGRDLFLKELIEKGLNVSIWGNRWHKSPLFEYLSMHYKGGALGGKDYVAAIQGAKISIGMLSKGNRDMHTQRSLEIPYIGGLFCGERTKEHMLMYRENVEAVFWNDVNECIYLCKDLLLNDDKRNSIRIAGQKRVLELKVGNEDICGLILNKLEDI